MASAWKPGLRMKAWTTLTSSPSTSTISTRTSAIVNLAC
eukprot:CAMPEP_0181217476 /NCGR_PEP_ID=MMETSP1096-20121128/27169_1 /TAXON_ID=156174 ORGANISM="Chrysochromulina ericina, Strain CCMP281" /NCGR_SAMPLE_ID=MMETSP1096 /ASSEMBLY_ACC=CAM_ASM_000453 /LENGTH=38 /DNA_ID= /DNA_START= /DNA_END= /DNA_ORIENTATION=